MVNDEPNFCIDAFLCDYFEMKKLRGEFIKECMKRMFAEQAKVRWDEERKLDLILAK